MGGSESLPMLCPICEPGDHDYDPDLQVQSFMKHMEKAHGNDGHIKWEEEEIQCPFCLNGEDLTEEELSDGRTKFETYRIEQMYMHCEFTHDLSPDGLNYYDPNYYGCYA